MLQVLGNPHTWPPFLAFFCLYVGTGNLMLWAVPFLRDVYGLSTTGAAACASAPAVALLFAGPLTGYVSDHVVRRRKLPYVALAGSSCALWLVFVLTLGSLPSGELYALFFAMGAAGGAFVLTWPIGREVNPPHLAGVAVAVTNLGGFLGAALSQGPFGAVLDARWAGVMADGARVYPLAAYRLAFGFCALFMLAAAAVALLLRETRGRTSTTSCDQARPAADRGGAPARDTGVHCEGPPGAPRPNMDATLDFVQRHGYALVFGFVLVEQLGLPLPAIPVLLAMGALAAAGSMSLPLILGVALAAALPVDLAWHQLGRRRGAGSCPSSARSRSSRTPACGAAAICSPGSAPAPSCSRSSSRVSPRWPRRSPASTAWHAGASCCTTPRP